MAEPSTYQSLYRRYRSQRFDQVLGQDHITNALRNAVRDGRVGHAYLFSGPRGTGKTSTARILAKVLNCAQPVDGEPCGQCDNCLAVERGQEIDWLLEQDAASKSKVDDMRDLLDRVPLGTSGERKVIILDEVHMLSQGAENALLKTLEEPPSHVVFVLATTDPQKVRPTIRSRTQHFEFHLLSADVTAAHVRHVIDDAELPLAADHLDEVVNHVVRAGGGSARDTLSALDQVAALGEVFTDQEPVDAILDAMAAGDVGATLAAVADAVSTGREPRTLGEALIARLRDSFLAIMGAADEQLTPAQRDRARQVGEAFGPTRLTRSLEVLGDALTELARKPDPRIVVEVALVRLSRPEADTSLDALAARVAQLERALQSGAGQAPAAGAGDAAVSTAASPAPVSPAPAPIEPPPAAADTSDDLPPASTPAVGGGQADTARAALARTREEAGRAAPAEEVKPSSGLAALANSAPAEPAASPLPSPAPEPASEPAVQQASGDPSPQGSPPEPVPTEPAAAAGAAPGQTAANVSVDLAQLNAAWTDSLLGELPLSVRSKWRGGRWLDVVGGTARFVVPNEWHKKACDEGRADVEKVLSGHFGGAVPVEVVVEGGGTQPGPAGGVDDRSPAPRQADRSGSSLPATTAAPDAGSDGGLSDADGYDYSNIDELEDAPDVATSGIDLLVDAFGGELVSLDPPNAP